MFATLWLDYHKRDGASAIYHLRRPPPRIAWIHQPRPANAKRLIRADVLTVRAPVAVTGPRIAARHPLAPILKALLADSGVCARVGCAVGFGAGDHVGSPDADAWDIFKNERADTGLAQPVLIAAPHAVNDARSRALGDISDALTDRLGRHVSQCKRAHDSRKVFAISRTRTHLSNALNALRKCANTFARH